MLVRGGRIKDDVVGIEQCLFGQTANVLVIDLIVKESSLSPPRHDASQMELGQMLGDRSRLGTYVLREIVDGVFAMQ